MATARLVIKKSYLKRSGRTPIYIQYIFKSDDKILVNTGYEVQPEHWNPTTQCLREKALDVYGKNFSELNALLVGLMTDFKTFLSNAYSRQITPTIRYVKDNFKQYVINKKQAGAEVPSELLTVYDHIDDYIEQKKEDVTVDTLKDYRALKKHLKLFEKSRGYVIDFTSFNYAFYDEFIEFLFNETMKPNGERGLLTNAVGKPIKNLKAFLRDRIRKGFCSDLDLSTYKTVTEEVDRVYLSWSEISTIYHYDLSNYEDLIITRDLLVLGCLIGLRFSDLSRIVPEFITNSHLRIRQKKVRRDVQIPILGDAAAILTRYNWKSPSIPMHEFNKNLKTLGRIVGLDKEHTLIHYKRNQEIKRSFKKFELLSSHICRRSFCTNEYLDGTDIHLIMRISGHRTERAFLTYLKMDEVVAAKKIAEKWQNRQLL